VTGASLSAGKSRNADKGDPTGGIDGPPLELGAAAALLLEEDTPE